MAYKPVYINASGTGSATIDAGHDTLHAVIVANGAGTFISISDSASYDSTKVIATVDTSRLNIVPLDILLTTGLSWSASGVPSLTLLLGR